MTETVKKPRTATTNKFQIAANIEKWFERLSPRDRPWMLEMLQVAFGKQDSAGPDRMAHPSND